MACPLLRMGAIINYFISNIPVKIIEIGQCVLKWQLKCGESFFEIQ